MLNYICKLLIFLHILFTLYLYSVDCDAAPIASVVTPAEQMAGIMVGSLSAIVLLLAVVAVYFARDFIRIKCEYIMKIFSHSSASVHS